MVFVYTSRIHYKACMIHNQLFEYKCMNDLDIVALFSDYSHKAMSKGDTNRCTSSLSAELEMCQSRWKYKHINIYIIYNIYNTYNIYIIYSKDPPVRLALVYIQWRKGWAEMAPPVQRCILEHNNKHNNK